MRSRVFTKGIAVVAVAIVAAALPTVASASSSSYNRNCGTPRDGWVVGPEDANNNYPWEVTGPWHINMTNGPAQARTLARRFPVQEFNTWIPVSAMPCETAQSVALSASEKWAYWPGNNGWANTYAYTQGGTVYLGLYHCTGRRTYDGAKESCTSTLDRGTITVSFTISPNPYNQ